MSLKSICTDPKLFSVNREKLQSDLVTLRACKFMDSYTIITIYSLQNWAWLSTVQLTQKQEFLKKQKDSPSINYFLETRRPVNKQQRAGKANTRMPWSMSLSSIRKTDSLDECIWKDKKGYNLICCYFLSANICPKVFWEKLPQKLPLSNSLLPLLRVL